MWPIGVMLNSLGPDRLAAFGLARQLGFEWVHTGGLPESWLHGPAREQYVERARASGVKIASMFIGFDGQSYADLPSIRRTVGLVIPELRQHRREVALQYCGLAAELKAGSLAAHIGFIPQRRNAQYRETVKVVRDLASACVDHGLTLNLETGQDSASVLLQFLGDVNHPAVGVNFDPANFILYGSDEPISALESLGSYVRGVHCKDAVRRSGDPGTPADEPFRLPVVPEKLDALGTEVPLGAGEVNFPAFLAHLARLPFSGPLIIERETALAQSVLLARTYLEKILPTL